MLRIPLTNQRRIESAVKSSPPNLRAIHPLVAQNVGPDPISPLVAVSSWMSVIGKIRPREGDRVKSCKIVDRTGSNLEDSRTQTALTEARSTQVQALRDYAVARARLERASGDSAPQTVVQK